MYRRFRYAAACVLLTLVLGACGQQATSSTGGDAMPGMTAVGGADATSAAMDHSTMPGMETTATAGAGMGGMHHGAMPANSEAPYDARFIDSMIEHHRGAISMAQQALDESERAEIKQLAQNIIGSQQQEIDQMTAWRKQWYPELESTGGMGMEMGDMELSADASKPFDQRFITAMIAHHNGAIAMARDAQTKAEHAEIKTLAEAIIKAQESEVAQLQQWQREWFGG